MRLECVTVCVDYGDILAQVASYNRRVLDRWIVVTTAEDTETREVCSRHSIEVMLCNEFKRDGVFSKGRGINHGLRQMTGDGWLLHIDADIALPYDLRQCLEDAHLQKEFVYGCNRLCVPYSAWPAVQAQGLYSRYNGWIAEYRDRPPGCYVGGVPAGIGNGYSPIGFFQLWWGEQTLSWCDGRKWYPVTHGHAARTDTQFSSLWSRVHRAMIPELTVFHLECDTAKDGMGQNWHGRKTARYPVPGLGARPVRPGKGSTTHTDMYS